MRRGVLALLLVEGCGICLGCASSFRLLMDLAGVECMTAAGAMKKNREDHAWNMARLEREWYCVDPACGDPVGNEVMEDEAQRAELHHPRAEMDTKRKEERHACYYRFCTGPQIKGAARDGHPAHHRQGEGVHLQHCAV